MRLFFTEEQIKDKYLLNEMFTNDLIIDILSIMVVINS